MPYSFTQIEEDKTRTISFVFSALILFYFVTFWLIAALVKSYYGSQGTSTGTLQFSVLNFPQTLITIGVAAAFGYAHWTYTTANLIPKIIGVLKAEKLNPKDTYHQKFQNIVEEVSVATGGKKMEAVVIPTMAMNAFALADFSGRSVIGVTEGMLARLTRAQLEAVVGHEAAHIVTGDCLTTTITSSLFELYSGLLKGFELMFVGGGVHRRRYISVRGRGVGGAAVLVLLIYALLVVTKFLSQIVRLFISRQREYRADAIAVRLTRDPLSLAEALYAIKYRWRGNGLAAQELEAIFTVNPTYSSIDERDGLWAEMFSTHPPMEGRLKILLDMAHTDAESMVQEVERKSHRPRISVPQVSTASTQWTVNREGKWQGPFNLAQLATLGWMRPETWVQRVGERDVTMAYEDSDIGHMITQSSEGDKGSAYHCPKCQIPLSHVMYEGTEIYKCPFCQGTLVGENDIQRIIIRQEVGFSDKIKKIAEGIQKEDQLGTSKVIDRDPKTMLKCPTCQHHLEKMLRMFYTEAYRVEIDKCFTCGHLWFDKDELEVVQYLIEATVEKV